MAETKERKVVRADGTPAKKPSTSANKTAPKTTNSGKKLQEAAPVGNATGLRIGAIVLWILAIAFEVLAILVLFGKINLTFKPQQAIWFIILFLVLDLVCLIIGSQLWKKANHIDPASEKNKVKFWLWNNMGVIVAAVAFIPFIVLTLTNKNVDKKTKTIATIAAVVGLLIGGAAGIDYNPVSQEQKQAAMEEITDDVYWTRFGHVYHTSEDCQALANSEELVYGNVEEAIAANRVRLCAFCAKRDNITDLATDDADVDMAIEDAVDEVEEALPDAN